MLGQGASGGALSFQTATSFKILSHRDFGGRCVRGNFCGMDPMPGALCSQHFKLAVSNSSSLSTEM